MQPRTSLAATWIQSFTQISEKKHYAGFDRAWEDNFVALTIKNPEGVLDIPTLCKDGEYRNMRLRISGAYNSAGNVMVLIAGFALVE